MGVRSRRSIRTAVLSAGMVLALQACGGGAGGGMEEPAPAAAGGAAMVSYAQQVQPIFNEFCTRCHGEQRAQSGLNLATYEMAMKGSSVGPVIEPGNGMSMLVDLVEAGVMPYRAARLSDENIEIIKNWVIQGAQNN